MIETAQTLENLTLNVTQEIRVRASLEVTFDSLLEQLGSENSTPEGAKLAMKIEPWPGGRWYRDLGGDNGHLWGHVQAIKRPTLFEITGPLFMSYPVVSNVQYRLSSDGDDTIIHFRHSAFGLIQDDHRENVGKGWTFMNDRIRARAEGGRRP